MNPNKNGSFNNSAETATSDMNSQETTWLSSTILERMELFPHLKLTFTEQFLQWRK